MWFLNVLYDCIIMAFAIALVVTIASAAGDPPTGRVGN